MGRKRIRILNIGKDKLHFVDCKDDEGDMSRNYKGELYYTEGKTRIKIIEHFIDDGRQLNKLVQNVIQNEAAIAPVGKNESAS